MNVSAACPMIRNVAVRFLSWLANDHEPGASNLNHGAPVSREVDKISFSSFASLSPPTLPLCLCLYLSASLFDRLSVCLLYIMFFSTVQEKSWIPVLWLSPTRDRRGRCIRSVPIPLVVFSTLLCSNSTDIVVSRRFTLPVASPSLTRTVSLFFCPQKMIFIVICVLISAVVLIAIIIGCLPRS